MTTKDELIEWLNHGKKLKSSHMLVVCDTWDYEDYPVYVQPEQNLAEVCRRIHGANMEKIMECYDLSMNLDKQLNERRAWHGWHP